MVDRKENHPCPDQQDPSTSNVISSHDGDQGKDQRFDRFIFVGALEQEEGKKCKGQEGDLGHHLVGELKQRCRDKTQHGHKKSQGSICISADKSVNDRNGDRVEDQDKTFKRDKAAGDYEIYKRQQKRETKWVFGVRFGHVAQRFGKAIPGSKRASEVDKLGIVTAERQVAVKEQDPHEQAQKSQERQKPRCSLELLKSDSRTRGRCFGGRFFFWPIGSFCHAL